MGHCRALVGGDDCPIDGGVDSLAEKPSVGYDMVLTNPPFGKKSSITVINEEGDESKEALTYVRDDFRATTSNKQLNFLQHVKSCRRATARCCVLRHVLQSGSCSAITLFCVR